MADTDWSSSHYGNHASNYNAGQLDSRHYISPYPAQYGTHAYQSTHQSPDFQHSAPRPFFVQQSMMSEVQQPSQVISEARYMTSALEVVDTWPKDSVSDKLQNSVSQSYREPAPKWLSSSHLPPVDDSVKRQPHLFISDMSLVVDREKRVKGRLEQYLSKYEDIRQVLMDNQGYYVTFENSERGARSLMECYRRENGSTFMGYTLCITPVVQIDYDSQVDGLIHPIQRNKIKHSGNVTGEQRQSQVVFDALKNLPKALAPKPSRGSIVQIVSKASTLTSSEQRRDYVSTPAQRSTLTSSKLQIASKATPEPSLISTPKDRPKGGARRKFDKRSANGSITTSDVSSVRRRKRVCYSCTDPNTPSHDPLKSCRSCNRQFHDSCRKPAPKPNHEASWICYRCLEDMHCRTTNTPKDSQTMREKTYASPTDRMSSPGVLLTRLASPRRRIVRPAQASATDNGSIHKGDVLHKEEVSDLLGKSESSKIPHGQCCRDLLNTSNTCWQCKNAQSATRADEQFGLALRDHESTLTKVSVDVSIHKADGTKIQGQAPPNSAHGHIPFHKVNSNPNAQQRALNEGILPSPDLGSSSHLDSRQLEFSHNQTKYQKQRSSVVMLPLPNQRSPAVHLVNFPQHPKQDERNTNDLTLSFSDTSKQQTNNHFSSGDPAQTKDGGFKRRQATEGDHMKSLELLRTTSRLETWDSFVGAAMFDAIEEGWTVRDVMNNVIKTFGKHAKISSSALDMISSRIASTLSNSESFRRQPKVLGQKYHHYILKPTHRQKYEKLKQHLLQNSQQTNSFAPNAHIHEDCSYGGSNGDMTPKDSIPYILGASKQRHTPINNLSSQEYIGTRTQSRRLSPCRPAFLPTVSVNENDVAREDFRLVTTNGCLQQAAPLLQKQIDQENDKGNSHVRALREIEPEYMKRDSRPHDLILLDILIKPIQRMNDQIQAGTYRHRVPDLEPGNMEYTMEMRHRLLGKWPSKKKIYGQYAGFTTRIREIQNELCERYLHDISSDAQEI